jgi:hypothetical protein
MSSQLPREPRQDRPFAEQHEEWMAHLRRQVVSRRTVVNEQGRELDRVVFARVAGGVA